MGHRAGIENRDREIRATFPHPLILRLQSMRQGKSWVPAASRRPDRVLPLWVTDVFAAIGELK